jgi:hypothetical protein
MSTIFTNGINTEVENYIKENMEYDRFSGTLRWKGKGGFNRDSSKPIGSLNGRGYLQVGTPYKNLRVHQICWYLFYGEWPTGIIDHINGDRTDNRPENLREATLSQNAGNSKPHKDGSSKYKGVGWDKNSKGWAARCKHKWLGRFECEHEAGLAYNYAAEKAFGPFANFNRVFHDI